MIRTADRMGHITEEDSFQNNLLEKIYGSVAGRMMIRPHGYSRCFHCHGMASGFQAFGSSGETLYTVSIIWI